MFVRKKQNKSGKVSVQVDQKDRMHRQQVVKTIGCGVAATEIEALVSEGRAYIERCKVPAIPGLDECEDDNTRGQGAFWTLRLHEAGGGGRQKHVCHQLHPRKVHDDQESRARNGRRAGKTMSNHQQLRNIYLRGRILFIINVGIVTSVWTLPPTMARFGLCVHTNSNVQFGFLFNPPGIKVKH